MSDGHGAIAPLLAAFFKSYGRRSSVQSWMGSRPPVRKTALLPEIAAQIGYPSAAINPFEGEGLPKITRDRAATLIAFTATRSLAYQGFTPPKQGVVKEARAALADLGQDAVFYTNGDWLLHSSHASFTSLSSATFDCGVIGYDSEMAFIFWAEDED